MIAEAEVDLEITANAYHSAEIIAAFRILKNGKAPWHGTLDVELFKANPESAASALHGSHVHNNPGPFQSPFSHEGVISDVVVFEFDAGLRLVSLLSPSRCLRTVTSRFTPRPNLVLNTNIGVFVHRPPIFHGCGGNCVCSFEPCGLSRRYYIMLNICSITFQELVIHNRNCIHWILLYENLSSFDHLVMN